MPDSDQFKSAHSKSKPPNHSKKSKNPAMGKGHRYQRSSVCTSTAFILPSDDFDLDSEAQANINLCSKSGATFNSAHRKRNFVPRNASTQFHYSRDGSFDARPNQRYGFAPQGPHPPPPPPPHAWQWHPHHPHHPGRFPPVGSPPPRPFDTTPPAIPYDFPHPPPHPQPFYPPAPYVADRGFGGPFRRSADHDYHEYQNRLFLDEYRFPGPHQVRPNPPFGDKSLMDVIFPQAYQPPHVGPALEHHLERPWRGENVSEMEERPQTRTAQLRGDAPEFVPHWKSPANEELVPEPKAKEPCWLVVSSS
ncbi:hypothetical protein BDV19DRAFT_385821 [Aspergillus venezuelensis]